MDFVRSTVSVEKKRFFRYKDGAKHYSMSQSTFEKLAKDAGAVYKYGGSVLVNSDIVDEYLELFKEKD